jgi:hypothetical protein
MRASTYFKQQKLMPQGHNVSQGGVRVIFESFIGNVDCRQDWAASSRIGALNLSEESHYIGRRRIRERHPA